MPGAESVVPHLLRGMMEAPKLPVVSIGVGRKDRDEALAMAAANCDCRRKLRLLIEKIGGTQLPGQLVKILHDTPAGEGCRAGLDVGLLQLMEEFPDPAAQPLLRRLLESPNHLTRLHAARVLGRLGDASGVPILLEDMLLDGSPFFEHHEKVGAVLNAIASPQTPPLLVDLYAQSSQAKRRRVLEVIALQDDPVYIAFWESLLDQNDETLVKAASEGIGRIVRTTGREVKSDQIVPGDKVHDSIIALMRWAFRDQAPTPRDGPFEDRDVFAEAGRALVLTSPWQCLVYDSSTDTLRQLEYGNPADNKFIKEARESADVVMSGGQVREFGDYVVVDLQLSPTDYLFRRRDGKCKPIGRCLKSME